MFTVYDWYWIVGGDAANVWSSARATSVPVGDADYQAWLALNPAGPTPIDTQSNLEAYFVSAFPSGSLTSYSGFVRDRTIGVGIIVSGNIPFRADTFTLAQLNGAYIYTQSVPSHTFQWKLPDGSFVTLNAAQIVEVQGFITDYTSKCYACESTTQPKIDNGTVTTLAQVDAAYAAVSNAYTLTKEAGKIKVQKRKSA